MKSKPYPLIALFAIIFALIAGCAGMQVNWNVDKEDIAELAANESGYQMALHLPDEAQVALKYAQKALAAGEPMEFNEQLQAWKDYALEKAGLNRHYQRQLDKFMPEIQLPEGSMPDLKWLEKVKPYLQEFIYGVEDGLEEQNIVQRYNDLYFRALVQASLR